MGGRGKKQSVIEEQTLPDSQLTEAESRPMSAGDRGLLFRGVKSSRADEKVRETYCTTLCPQSTVLYCALQNLIHYHAGGLFNHNFKRKSKRKARPGVQAYNCNYLESRGLRFEAIPGKC